MSQQDAEIAELQKTIDDLNIGYERRWAQVQALTAERDDLRQTLGNLLARIHRDGGHYVEAYGIAKAAEDAGGIVVIGRVERDRLARELDAAREALRKISAVDAPSFGTAFGRCVDIANASLASPATESGPELETKGADECKPARDATAPDS